MTVFGVPLGTRFQLEECAKTSVGEIMVYQQATSVCFERLGSQEIVRATTPIENEAILIKYPGAAAPGVMSGAGAVGLVVDGNLEGVAFDTRGVDSQTEVMDTLKQKFGEPTSVTPRKVQNSLGELFDVADAGWTLPQAEILFRSVTSRVDTGLLSIDTAKAREFRKQRLAGPPAGEPRG